MPEIQEAVQAVRDIVARFLESCRDPAIIEPGDEPLPVEPGNWRLDSRSDRLTLQVWNETQNLVRRVRCIRAQRAGQIELEVERFYKKTGSLLLVDRARPTTRSSLPRRTGRMILRERLRWFLGRQFAGWRIAELTSEPVLEHSLSPTYPRAMVVQGGRAWAAIAAPDEATAADHALTFGLIWLDYLREREHRLLVEGLCLLLPIGKQVTACLRIPWLNANAARYSVFAYDSPDWEEPVEIAAHGNLDTEIPFPDDSPQPGLHSAGTGPEAELERIIRASPSSLDPDLLDAPVYGQVPALAGVERGILDLLGATHDGRLTVIELKASADPNLPMQALDYWLRVRWHHARGDFHELGYFPEVALRQDEPRLLLAAPALAFHSTTEAILRYFHPSIDVERIGVAVEWQRGLRVLFRLRGARSPR